MPVSGQQVLDLIPGQGTYRAAVEVRAPLRAVRVADVLSQVGSTLLVELYRQILKAHALISYLFPIQYPAHTLQVPVGPPQIVPQRAQRPVYGAQVLG